MRAVVLGSLVVAVVTQGACSATSGENQFPGAGGAGSAASTAHGASGTGTGVAGSIGQGAGVGAGTGASTGSGGPGCAQAAELVYVFSLQNDIWSFDPPSRQFTMVAHPDCPTTMTPNSMAIDRNLVAWLNYFQDSNTGAIFAYDLTKKTGCHQVVTLTTGYGQVGMGFSTDAVGGTAETLYVDGIGGAAAGLAKVDTTTGTLTPIGPFGNDTNLTNASAELTGTGDARLFGYFTTFPDVRVGQIDKANAGILSDNQLAGFPPPSDWAFSFWGGDFYLYAAPGAPGNNTTGNSSVIHYSPATAAVDLAYVKDVGFQIIGAGVSTCAPLMQPK